MGRECKKRHVRVVAGAETADSAELENIETLATDDDEVEPLYAAIFERPDLDLEAPGDMGRMTVREEIEQLAKARPIPYRMLLDYETRKAT